MKRRVAPILTFAIALVLISGLAYAARKKDQGKMADLLSDPTHEEEALQAELLAMTENRDVKVPDVGKASAKEVTNAAIPENIKGQMPIQPDK
jgi:hypothetical protein